MKSFLLYLFQDIFRATQIITDRKSTNYEKEKKWNFVVCLSVFIMSTGSSSVWALMQQVKLIIGEFSRRM